MPYEDYMKFIELSETELPDNIALLSPFKNKQFPFIFCKLHNINTTFIYSPIREYSETYGGIFIDIFPLCGAPLSELSRKIFMSSLQSIKILNTIRRNSYSEMEPLRSKRLAWSIFFWVKFLTKYDFFSSACYRLIKKFPFGNSDTMTFPWRRYLNEKGSYRTFFHTEDFTSQLEVPFEDTVISIPSGYDRYLRMDFGDYMKLPPESARISSHSQGVIIDLERPYKYYVDEYKKC